MAERSRSIALGMAMLTYFAVFCAIAICASQLVQRFNEWRQALPTARLRASHRRQGLHRTDAEVSWQREIGSFRQIKGRPWTTVAGSAGATQAEPPSGSLI